MSNKKSVQCLWMWSDVWMVSVKKVKRFAIYCMKPSEPWHAISVRPAKTQPLLVTWIFYDCLAIDQSSFGVSKLKRSLLMSKSVTLPHCRKSHVTAQMSLSNQETKIRNYEWNLERTSNSSHRTHPVRRVLLKGLLEEVLLHITHLCSSLHTLLKDMCMCLQDEWKLCHSSYRTSAIFKYFCPLVTLP